MVAYRQILRLNRIGITNKSRRQGIASLIFAKVIAPAPHLGRYTDCINKHTIITINIIIFLIVLVTLGCESAEDKYFKIAANYFTKYFVADIKDDLQTLIPYALALKKEEEKSDAELAKKMWESIDPNYDSQKLKAELRKTISKLLGQEFQIKLQEKNGFSKWTFWEDIAKAPNKYIAKTKDGDIFLEYEISKYNNDTHYYSAKVKILFAKDNRLAFFRIFFIYTPDKNWKQVDYEFGWPHQLSAK
ncbi:MAG: hypothetical protein WC581_11005 [Thermodesulfovibrionales bacterium]